MGATSGAGFTKLFFVVVEVILIGTTTIESASAVIYIISVCTFFGLFLGLGSLGGAFLFNNWESLSH